MSQPSDVRTVLDFVKAINEHDVEGMLSMASRNHRLVDGLGQVVTGRDELRKAWSGYFDLFPDYHVSVTRCLGRKGVVGLFGSARGSFHRRNWEIPAAWMVVVKNRRVLEWRVYADNEPVWKLLGVRRY